MFADLTPLDIAALTVFVFVWIGYNTLFEGPLRPKNSINARMVAVREIWMVRFLERDNRIMDAQLIGNSIRTASFFASTTILVIAGLVGIIGAAGDVHARVTTDLSVLFQETSLVVFEIKLFLLIAIFVYGFFKFTWAIRQFNYFSGILGSAPYYQGAPVDRALAKRMCLIRSHAVWELNGGIRAYYFGLATLGWFVHPLFFMATTLFMMFVIIWRQLFSATARALREHVANLPAELDGESGGGTAAGM